MLSLVNTLQRLRSVMKTELDEYSVGSSERADSKEKAFNSTPLAVRVESLARELNAIRAEADKLIKRTRFSQFVHSKGHHSHEGYDCAVRYLVR
ncbi:hypothetical protein K466DRAFT_38153 [Polyporus arcularius HHB13444]|uniref:Uncharacterized protein n=1 Tax=Polyporus arcularius HHB13444 TaxID=1314778 RepID=A0A5C3NR85_9APHY|nr:hypothetical protein K466DRAFT_38153 [Polyporus arcularius HHB13444]